MNIQEIITNRKIKQIIKILLFSIISIILMIVVIEKNIKKLKEYSIKKEDQNIKINLAKTPRTNYPKTETIWANIEIPSVKINTSVYRGENIDYLNYGAMHHKESYFPTEGGTILIVGNDKYFKNLKDVKEKDEINIKTVYGTYKYKVIKTSIKNAEKFGNELEITNSEEKLILYTTYPDIPGYKSDRFIVYASLVGEAK